MENLFDPKFYVSVIETAKNWMISNILIWDNLVHVVLQIVILVVVRVIGSLLGRWVRNAIRDRISRHTIHHKHIANFVNRLVELLPLLCGIFLLWVAIGIAEKSGLRIFLMRLVLNLSVAWVVIQLATSVILDRFWARLVAALAWSLAALNILGLLDETLMLLESIGFTVGSANLTLLSILKALILLMILLRGVHWLNLQIEQGLGRVTELTPSTRLMIVKSINIALLFLVTLVALNSVGIDLTALAVFSGAVGVGVGFGLQKVVANFVSGIILLSDKSIKPGDVIEIGDVYGWVNNMSGRYVSIITRDEKEYLIPNESLITNSVVNWSHSSKRIRIKAGIGISYNADPREAIELIIQSLDGLDRIQNDPAPKCLLIGFGESSIDLQLRFWIKDPQNGVANITSEALLIVWDTLKANEIEIPFPQRDIHLKGSKGLSITEASGENRDA